MPDIPLLKQGAKVGPGRFTLIKELGRGGMGVVWLAQDERLHQPVALKFLPPEVGSDPVPLDDLRRETARSRRLAHPNIIRIHDLHEPAGELAFISMEYVDGPTLSSLRLERPNRWQKRQLPPNEVPAGNCFGPAWRLPFSVYWGWSGGMERFMATRHEQPPAEWPRQWKAEHFNGATVGPRIQR